MDWQFSRRALRFQPNIFNVLKDLKGERLARGEWVCDLSVGTPDFPVAEHIRAAAAQAALDPENYKYSLGDLPELTQAVQRWYARRYGVTLAENEVMSVYGSQEGIAHIAMTLCDPGDVVLVPDPCYPIFAIGPSLCGAEVAYYPLDEESGYLPDLAAIDEEIARRAKMMIVSFPANPVGAVAPRAFYDDLVAFARKYSICVVHDNAYSEIVFDGNEGMSFLSVPGAMEVGVEFNSLSKTYNLTGARLSFLLGNKAILERFRALRTQIDYGLFYVAQRAAIAALDGPQEGVVRQRAEYQRRRDALCHSFTAAGWEVPDAKGTMFVWAKTPRGWEDDEAFVTELFHAHGHTLHARQRLCLARKGPCALRAGAARRRNWRTAPRGCRQAASSADLTGGAKDDTIFSGLILGRNASLKRFCTALMALLLLFGCARAEEDIFAATITSPTPTAGVGSIGLAISEYTYAVISNDTLGVRFSYPSHWEQTPGRRTICYQEPVAEGDIPARMAVSVKQLRRPRRTTMN